MRFASENPTRSVPARGGYIIPGSYIYFVYIYVCIRLRLDSLRPFFLRCECPNKRSTCLWLILIVNLSSRNNEKCPRGIHRPLSALTCSIFIGSGTFRMLGLVSLKGRGTVSAFSSTSARPIFAFASSRAYTCIQIISIHMKYAKVFACFFLSYQGPQQVSAACECRRGTIYLV